MEEIMQALQVCNPTKMDDSSFFIDLSTAYMLVVSKIDDGWHYQVFKGNDKDGWFPHDDGKEVYNSAVDKIEAIVSGWKFLYT